MMRMMAYLLLCVAAATALPSAGVSDMADTMLAAKATSKCEKPAKGEKPNFGSCITVESVKIPEPIVGEALIRMSTSSVNPSDLDITEGALHGLFGTLGADFAGEVVKVGPLCSSLAVGDKVWGCSKGTYSEYAIVFCALTGKLGSVSPAEVGTLPEVSMTSAEALKKTGAPWDPAKNLTVVVTSGSGGTGFVGVQLAKAYGAGKIITATSGADKIAFVKSLGADVVVDYREQEIFSALQNDTVDIVYDNYGAPGTADRAMPTLREGGIFIFLPGKDGAVSKHPKSGVKQINYGLMTPSRDTLNEMLTLYKSGALRPHVQASYSLSNVSAAFDESATGGVVGKLAITMHM